MSIASQSEQKVSTVEINTEILGELRWLCDELSKKSILNPDGKKVNASLALRHALSIDAFIHEQISLGNAILVKDKKTGRMWEMEWENITEFSQRLERESQ